MATFIRALALSLILFSGPFVMAKKKEKKESFPEVIQIAPMAYERGANYILNPLRPAYEEYLKSHPTVVDLKNQQAAKGNEYRQKEDELILMRQRCDAITNPNDPKKTECFNQLQTLNSELEAVRRLWSDLKVKREEAYRKLRYTLTPPLLNIFQIHLGILLQFATQNYAYLVTDRDSYSVLGVYSGDAIRKNFTLYAISMDYYPSKNSADLKMILQSKTNQQLYTITTKFRAQNSFDQVLQGIFSLSYGGDYLLIADQEALFKALRSNIMDRLLIASGGGY